jgi:hypothetical protein
MKNGMILWAVSGVAAMGLAAACSSSSGGGSSPAPDAGTPEDTGSSTTLDSGSSSGGDTGTPPAAMCTGTSDCTTAGQVCCGTFTGGMPGAACQAGPCPALPVVGAIQLCSADSDCTAPATCGPNATLDALEPGLKTCAAPAAAGDGGPTTGDSGSDAAPVVTGDAGDGG